VFHFKNKKINQIFLQKDHPYAQTAKPNTALLKGGGALFVVVLVVFLVAIPSAPKKTKVKTQFTEEPLKSAPSSSPSRDDGFEPPLRVVKDAPVHGTSQSRQPRSYTSSQIVRRNSESDGSKLPIATTAPVFLLNRVLSSDADAPVIVQFEKDVLWDNSLLIPRDTKAIGQGVLDETSKRLRTRFQILVFPDGTKHRFSALALMPDGTFGIPGDFHSGVLEKNAGRALGTFVSGMAEGLKDRTNGPFGLYQEPGTLKNSLLNGVATTSIDQAKESADDIRNVRTYLEIPEGAQFLLYFEQEFSL
jgi:hypothetical protein